MSCSTERGEVVKRMIQDNPDAPTKTLARRLLLAHPKWFKDLESARRCLRYYRGNAGQRTRGIKVNAETHRPNGKAGWKPSLPPSLAEPWERYELPCPAKILCLSDVHIPYHDAKAVEAAIAYAKKHVKPNVILLNGDIADFYSVSRWEKNPGKRDLLEELRLVRDFLGWLKLEFPKAKMVYKLGNHEERWDHYIWAKAADLWGMAALRIDQILTRDDDNESLALLEGIDFIGDQRPIMAGHLPILHGHELMRGLTSPVNPARGAFMRTIHTLLIGHGHRSSSHAEPNMWHEEIVCWSQGCLCDLHPEYARTNKWNHGFAVIETASNREFEVLNYRVQDGKVRRS
jgi:predicted phosphodiesterase